MSAHAAPGGSVATVATVLASARGHLVRAGIDTAPLDARLLVGHALGLAAPALIGRPERPVTAAECAAVEALLARRRRREPLAYLVGHREFWSHRFAVSEATLIPRPDTETLIEAALRRLPADADGLRVLDLGTGSGCLLLTLLRERDGLSGIGTDLSAAALAVARTNAEALGLAARAAFVCADWTAGIAGRFDVVVSNPPYVARAAWPTLAPEVGRFEPVLALNGGTDGLESYRRIVPMLSRLMAAGATALLEVGAGQADAVRALAATHGLVTAGVECDLGGVPRCVILTGEPAHG